MNRSAAAVLLLIALSIVAVVNNGVIVGDVLRLPSYVPNFFRPADDDYVGKRWAVLIAGFNGYSNYGHQVKKTTSQDGAISQRDADLLYFWEKYRWAPEGSARKIKAQKQLAEALSHRMHLDDSVNLVGNLLFGIKKGSEVLKAIRPAGQAVFDDWQCLRTLVIQLILYICSVLINNHPTRLTPKGNDYVRTFETHCGSLSEYGLKHMRSFANFCNAGIREDQMSEASAQACVTFPSNPWSSVHKGFNA